MRKLIFKNLGSNLEINFFLGILGFKGILFFNYSILQIHVSLQ